MVGVRDVDELLVLVDAMPLDLFPLGSTLYPLFKIALLDPPST